MDCGLNFNPRSDPPHGVIAVRFFNYQQSTAGADLYETFEVLYSRPVLHCLPFPLEFSLASPVCSNRTLVDICMITVRNQIFVRYLGYFRTLSARHCITLDPSPKYTLPSAVSYMYLTDLEIPQRRAFAWRVEQDDAAKILVPS